jgi:hypothetical protein
VKLTETQKTGADVKRGDIIEQWGALWRVMETGGWGAGSVWFSLDWITGNRKDCGLYHAGPEDLGGGTSVDYGKNEPVTIVTIEV